jgi:hypothetical protein
LSGWLNKGLPAPATRVRLALDLPVSLGLGAAICAVCALHLAYAYLYDPALSDDLIDYCVTTDTLRQGLWSDPEHMVSRPPFPALLSAALAAHLGIMQGLGISSLVVSALLAMVFYFWGLILHSRVAGIAAALLMAAVGPLVLASRSYGTYPEAAVMLAAGAMLTTLALVRPSRATFAGAGVGVGLTLLADQFGLFWALPLLLVLLFVLLRGKRRPARALALAAPLLLSFIVGALLPMPWVEIGPLQSGKHPHTMEMRFIQHTIIHISSIKAPGEAGDNDPTGGEQENLDLLTPLEKWDGGYFWGHSNPALIPLSLYRVGSMAVRAVAAVVSTKKPDAESRDLSYREITPWLWISLILLVGLCIGWRREKRQLLALILPLLPFFGFLLLASQMTQERGELYFTYFSAAGSQLGPLYVKPKFMLIGLVPVPLLFGLVWAALFCAPLRGLLGRVPRIPARAAAPVLSVGLLALLVTGVLPSPLSPMAGWRMRYRSETMKLAQMQANARHLASSPGGDVITKDAEEKRCIQALARDVQAGRPISFWLVDEEARQWLARRMEIKPPEPVAPEEPPPSTPPPPPPPPDPPEDEPEPYSTEATDE